ncbi:tyrosine-type recombinase/integrase [Bradyrhizobium sp. McL0616]|uniref:tyrosine-type recombinase/integrase n=1 Tax=Bradyrhizobium sp. McL0616 TaxID=3415674 RepID=UPI003CF9C97E
MPNISEKIVGELEPKLDQHGKPRASTLYYFSGATLQGKKAPAGFAVRVTAAGTKAFVLFHRKDGKGYLETLGRWDANAQGGSLTVRAAIVEAEQLVKDFTKGNREDPRPERTRRLEDGNKPDGLDVAGLLDMFVTRYVEKEAKLRSTDQIKHTFERLVKPEIGDIGIYEIRRSHVINMLDAIADGEGGEDGDAGGPVMADRTLAYVRKAFNWYATRDDEFKTPIVQGMARTKPKDRQRKRVLADDEIRDLWAALETIEDVPACYPRFIKALLLTATRRNEASGMHGAELELPHADDGNVWKIPGDRYKTKLDHVIPLTVAALDEIGKVEKGARFIFSSDGGKTPFSGFSKAKRALDAEIAKRRRADGREPMPNWTLHDLRRTARTLMSRAKVDADHAERCLGHVMAVVRGTYDCWAFLDEKRAVFEALAALVDKILHPASNVELLSAHRAGSADNAALR